MSYVSQWQLRLLCDFCPITADAPDPNGETFYADTREKAFRLARNKGWKTYPAQVKAKCPKCREAELSNFRHRVSPDTA